MIDRIGPTRRPAGNPRGYHVWRSLLFMHWPVPIDVLRPLVPESLELDLFDDVAYVGVVPFEMEGVRPRWLPKSLSFSFLETNVRTYVRYRDKPGVFFLSLEAAHGPAVWAARKFWGLPYFHADMAVRRDGDDIYYRTERKCDGAFHRAEYQIGESLEPSSPDSLEFFFLERYLLFVERKGGLYAGQVAHTPYPAQLAHVSRVEDSLLLAAGVTGCEGKPEFAHYSSGVDVEVFDLKRMDA